MKRPTLNGPRWNALREAFTEQGRQLRELQWRELDIREAGSWPVSLQWLIALGVLMGSIWAAQWLLASTPRETHERLVMQQQQALQRFETLFKVGEQFTLLTLGNHRVVLIQHQLRRSQPNLRVHVLQQPR